MPNYVECCPMLNTIYDFTGDMQLMYTSVLLQTFKYVLFCHYGRDTASLNKESTLQLDR